MKELLFSISLNDYTFNVNTNHRRTLCSYGMKGKYVASLIFAANTYAHVNYKNILFSGTVTKRNAWRISLDMHVVVHKKNNMYYFETTKLDQDDEKKESLNDIDVETSYPKNILTLYDQLMDDFSEQYECITNKEAFQNQVCEYLTDNYYDIKNLDEILEYENYVDVAEDEEPIIEKYTVRSVLLDECEEFLVSFHQAEQDNIRKESIITLENVIKEVPELQKIPMEFLNQEFNNYLEKTLNDLIAPDIYYERVDMLYTVGMKLYDSYQHHIFLNTLENKIDKIVSAMKVEDINKDEIYSLCKYSYDKNNVPSDKELKQRVEDFVDNYTRFNQLYNEIFSLFNNDHIELEWDEQKINLFKEYEKDELMIEPQHVAEYKVYKYILPYIKKHLFRKNANKYKPVVEQFPNFISYASSVLDILFKYDILIDDEEKVVYNENGNFSSVYEEIEELTRQ